MDKPTKSKKKYGMRDFFYRVFTLISIIIFTVLVALSFAEKAKASDIIIQTSSEID